MPFERLIRIGLSVKCLFYMAYLVSLGLIYMIIFSLIVHFCLKDAIYIIIARDYYSLVQQNPVIIERFSLYTSYLTEKHSKNLSFIITPISVYMKKFISYITFDFFSCISTQIIYVLIVK